MRRGALREAASISSRATSGPSALTISVSCWRVIFSHSLDVLLECLDELLRGLGRVEVLRLGFVLVVFRWRIVRRRLAPPGLALVCGRVFTPLHLPFPL